MIRCFLEIGDDEVERLKNMAECAFMAISSSFDAAKVEEKLNNVCRYYYNMALCCKNAQASHYFLAVANNSGGFIDEAIENCEIAEVLGSIAEEYIDKATKILLWEYDEDKLVRGLTSEKRKLGELVTEYISSHAVSNHKNDFLFLYKSIKEKWEESKKMFLIPILAERHIIKQNSYLINGLLEQIKNYSV